jgi:DNA-binding response OmpR family regulator
VLVIDDESSVLRFTRKLLERAGFEVLTAPGGREGVGLFEQNSERVSAVLLDMTMPHMDGKATLVELQRIRQDVRVVLSSGFTEQSVIDRFAGTQLVGFVQKPYRARTLLGALRSALAAT